MSMLRTSDAAKGLGFPTLEFVARLHGMVGSWSECWPQVDEGYVETLRVLLAGPQGGRVKATGTPNSSNTRNVIGDEPCPHDVARHPARLIEKLWRQKRWGDMGVSLETIRRHMVRNVEDLEELIDDLVARKFLTAEDRRGPIALNPGRQAEIEAIAQWSCDHPDE
jgi:hypothetical protein